MLAPPFSCMSGQFWDCLADFGLLTVLFEYKTRRCRDERYAETTNILIIHPMVFRCREFFSQMLENMVRPPLHRLLPSQRLFIPWQRLFPHKRTPRLRKHDATGAAADVLELCSTTGVVAKVALRNICGHVERVVMEEVFAESVVNSTFRIIVRYCCWRISGCFV